MGELRGDRGLNTSFNTVSRTVSITNTVPATSVRLLQSNQSTDWEFVIRETTGITDIDITLTLTTEQSEFIVKQPLNRGGAWSYQGWGPVKIEAIAVNAGTGELQLSLNPQSSKIPYIMVAGQSTRQSLLVAGTFYPLDNLSNQAPSGYAPPFTKFVSLKPSGNSAIRFVDMTGTNIWQTAVLTPIDPFFDEIRIYPWFRIDIQPQGAAQFVSSLWYN
jgi:hypothetical protein